MCDSNSNTGYIWEGEGPMPLLQFCSPLISGNLKYLIYTSGSTLGARTSYKKDYIQDIYIAIRHHSY
jgi:hypothetical protein